MDVVDSNRVVLALLIRCRPHTQTGVDERSSARVLADQLAEGLSPGRIHEKRQGEVMMASLSSPCISIDSVRADSLSFDDS